jgi:type III secretory pathway component EscU
MLSFIHFVSSLCRCVSVVEETLRVWVGLQVINEFCKLSYLDQKLQTEEDIKQMFMT